MKRIEHGDMKEVLARLIADGVRVSSIVTDPPYHLTSIVKRFGTVARSDDTKTSDRSRRGADSYARLSTGFMGKVWDGGDVAFQPATWTLCYELLPPGGHLIAFGGTRTYHRLVCAIEDAGFEIRDQLAWIYGSGFPKSHNVAKGIDKRGGAADLTREVGAAIKAARLSRGISIKAADAKYCGGSTLWTWYEGRPAGQQLPIDEIMAAIAADWPELKSYAAAIAGVERAVIGSTNGSRLAVAPGQGNDRSDKTIETTAAATDAARQWDGWGTALKPAFEPIVLARKPLDGTVAGNVLKHGTGALNIDGCRIHAEDAQGGAYTVKRLKPGATLDRTGGNWRPEEGGVEYHGEMKPGRWPANVVHDGSDEVVKAFPDSGNNWRTDKGAGLGYHGADGERGAAGHADHGSAARFFYSAKADAGDRLGSKHPTVKPVDLMRWLVRLITPPAGVVLDPFAGSGSTAMACLAEGLDFIMVEQDADSVADIRRRLAHVRGDDTPLFNAQTKAQT